MNNFTINSACLPLFTNKEAVIDKTDMVFQTLANYIGENSKPVISLDKNTNELLLLSDYSLENYINDIIVRDRDLAEFVLEYSDTFKTIDCNDYNTLFIKVGDDTRYKDNLSLKYACKKNNILVSITDESLWERQKIEFTIYGIDFHEEYELCNLFNNDTSHLPLRKQPFQLKDNNEFVKTNYVYNNQIIYQELETGYFWYYDYFHKDNRAHYEVFDRFGNHIGEASMTGELNRSLADSRKTIKDLIK